MNFWLNINFEKGSFRHTWYKAPKNVIRCFSCSLSPSCQSPLPCIFLFPYRPLVLVITSRKMTVKWHFTVPSFLPNNLCGKRQTLLHVWWESYKVAHINLLNHDSNGEGCWRTEHPDWPPHRDHAEWVSKGNDTCVDMCLSSPCSYLFTYILPPLKESFISAFPLYS